MIIKGLIFALILTFAAFHDLKTKEVPDIIHILIILTALIDFNSINSILGLFIVPLPFLIVAVILEGGIGGGDIKLMGACGFLLGASSGFFASIVGLSIAVCVNLLKRKGKSHSFPLVPYLAIGCIVSYFLFQ